MLETFCTLNQTPYLYLKKKKYVHGSLEPYCIIIILMCAFKQSSYLSLVQDILLKITHFSKTE